MGALNAQDLNHENENDEQLHNTSQLGDEDEDCNGHWPVEINPFIHLKTTLYLVTITVVGQQKPPILQLVSHPTSLGHLTTPKSVHFLVTQSDLLATPEPITWMKHKSLLNSIIYYNPIPSNHRPEKEALHHNSQANCSQEMSACC